MSVCVAARNIMSVVPATYGTRAGVNILFSTRSARRHLLGVILIYT